MDAAGCRRFSPTLPTHTARAAHGLKTAHLHSNTTFPTPSSGPCLNVHRPLIESRLLLVLTSARKSTQKSQARLFPCAPPRTLPPAPQNEHPSPPSYSPPPSHSLRPLIPSSARLPPPALRFRMRETFRQALSNHSKKQPRNDCGIARLSFRQHNTIAQPNQTKRKITNRFQNQKSILRSIKSKRKNIRHRCCGTPSLAISAPAPNHV